VQMIEPTPRHAVVVRAWILKDSHRSRTHIRLESDVRVCSKLCGKRDVRPRAVCLVRHYVLNVESARSDLHERGELRRVMCVAICDARSGNHVCLGADERMKFDPIM